jgi:hypothetical protein
MPDKQHQKHREQDPNRPQSTDIADVEEMSEAEWEAAQKQSKAQRKPPEKKNVKARIIQQMVEGDRIRIRIGSGEQQGLRSGMEGYLMDASGNALTHFKIFGCEDLLCSAYVKVPGDWIIANPYVMLNPSSKSTK